MAEIGMERKTEHREFWGVSNELIGENHRRESGKFDWPELKREGGIYKMVGEQ